MMNSWEKQTTKIITSSKHAATTLFVSMMMPEDKLLREERLLFRLDFCLDRKSVV